MPIFSRLSSPLKSLGGVLDIFLASPCLLCGASSAGDLCLACQGHLRRCRLPQPSVEAVAGLSVAAWGGYRGHLRQAIAALKYQQRPAIARFLGAEMGSLWSAHWPCSPVVVPIPLHAERLQQRGFNQAELIAESFCRATGLSHCPAGLVRVRATTAQHHLSALQRQQNLNDAFALGSGLSSHHSVLLLDDIYTSGATAATAAATLQQQGIQVIGIAVAARALPAAPKSSESCV